MNKVYHWPDVYNVGLKYELRKYGDHHVYQSRENKVSLGTVRRIEGKLYNAEHVYSHLFSKDEVHWYPFSV